MTKAAVCTHCTDIIAPRRAWTTDRRWRWCECEHAGVRWLDGDRGLLEVTAMHGPGHVMVLGLNNQFFVPALGGYSNRPATAEAWRALHEQTCTDVPDYYLFHQDRRACWALLVQPGESGDITFVDYAQAVRAPLAQPDRAARS